MKLAKLLLATLVLTINAYAMPLGGLLVSPLANVQLDPNYDFNGIIRLSNCSGAVIRFTGMPDGANAIAMTNGHCYGGALGGMIKPNQIVLNKSISRSMKVYNNEQKLININAIKTLYATMTDTDVTLYQLKESYQDLKNKGVDSFDLDTDRPNLGMSLDIVSGYWDRGYRCNIDAFIYQLKESNWTMKDSIRYTASGCNTIGGTSGSPIIQTGTRTVVGINNTGNESGQKCTMNNPCEVDQNGKITVIPHASYGQQTYQIYSCLTVDFNIDLTLPNCKLFKN